MTSKSFLLIVISGCLFVVFYTRQHNALPIVSTNIIDFIHRWNTRSTLTHHTSNPNPPKPILSMDTVDIVYMWVDGSDPSWQRKTKQSLNSRNRDNDELKYSLRSLEKYLPWHRGRIFIVTPNQTPRWTNPDRVTIVNQTTLLPRNQGGTMTANSFYIEAHLHNIPGLSENFIYLNDDYMFSSPTSPADFFKLTSSGMVPVYYNTGNVIKYGFDKSLMFELSNSNIWLAATFYTNGLLNDQHGLLNDQHGLVNDQHGLVNDQHGLLNDQHGLLNDQHGLVNDSSGTYKHLGFQTHPRYFMAHAPYCLNVYECRRVYNKYKHYITKMGHHKTRHWKDVIFMLLYRYESKGFHERTATTLIKVTDNVDTNHQQYTNIATNPPFLFAVNDAFSSPSTGAQLTDFLESRFPDKSSFEL